MEHKSWNDLTKNVEGIIETKFIEIINDNGKNLIVGDIYRPPSGDFLTFKNTMNTILEKIDRKNKICYLIGDFNIDLFKSESCDYAAWSLMTFQSYFDHTEPIFNDLKILNLYKLNDFLTSLFMFRYFHLQNLPEIFNKYFLTNKEIHNYNTRNASLLQNTSDAI